MTMTPRLRKLALTAHVTVSVGWIGAVAAYLALALVALTTSDPERARAFYPAMELIGWSVIVPCSLAALVTGLIESAGTKWGFFRFHWVQVKLLLTVAATAVLLMHVPTVSDVARMALTGAEVQAVRAQLAVHAGGGLLVLLIATVLSIYKPWGRTQYGIQTERIGTGQIAVKSAGPMYVLLGMIALVLLIVVLHLHGGRPMSH